MLSVQAQIPISTIEELQKIGNDSAYPLDGSYFLTNDIDASATLSWNDGKGFEPIGKGADFSGSLYGRSYSIVNLFINRSDEYGVGLFYGTSKYSQVLSVKIINCKITGFSYVGILIGGSSGFIDNCHVTGDVKGGGNYIGGLAGRSAAVIMNSTSNCEIEGRGRVGGLVGENFNEITNCYSTGKITGQDVGGISGWNQGKVINSFSNAEILLTSAGSAGGLIGVNYNIVDRCYSFGPVQGVGGLGGLIGANGWFGLPVYEVTRSYYDYQTTGRYIPPIGKRGIPKTTGEMMNPATFVEWDFVNVWWMVPGKTYPLLRPERYIPATVRTDDWMPDAKHGLPASFIVGFDQPVKTFTFADIDFTSSTLHGLQGSLATDNGTTWTLHVTDCATTPTYPAEIVLRVPLAGAKDAFGYPCAESNTVRLTLAPPVPGDLNGDGVCDALDRAVMTDILLRPASPWCARLPQALLDQNRDSRLDAADLITLFLLGN